MSIFEHIGKERVEPLASRMRPRSLEEYVGQEHILGPGRLLRRAIQADQLSSLIFYGPPGTGKTTLARVIAECTKAHFMSINAVLSGVAQIRKSIEEAKQQWEVIEQRSILFVDEVHRFNKSQQDALLPHVEDGLIILIGATTENPYFEVNKALVSRSRVFELRSLEDKDLQSIIDHTLKNKERGLGKLNVEMGDDARTHLVKMSGGDARSLLNALELAIVQDDGEKVDGKIVIDLQTIEESIQKRAVLYDKEGDAHYDIISAFIKSIRGSDPDAALYWMARMISAGEDPKFIFRRMVISASEDIGLADPTALGKVMDACRAYDYVGMPEGRFHLAQACLILCTAPKSNSTMAFFSALRSIEEEKHGDVPNHLKDPSRDGTDLGHGKGYKYPHAFADHWVAQQYLPDSLKGKTFYQPSKSGFEAEIFNDVERRREAQFAAFSESVYKNDFSELGSHSWDSRTFEDNAAKMNWIRQKIFELANLSREDLILDVNPGSGLLLFEAARLSKVGGVHAWVEDDEHQGSLESFAQKLDLLERPQLHQFDIHNIEWKTDMKFDCIFIRHAMDREIDLKVLLKLCSGILQENGKIVLCEFLEDNIKGPSSYLNLMSLLDEAVRNEYKLLEKKFYGSSENNTNYFNEEIYRPSCEDIFNVEHWSRQEFALTRKMSRHQIEHWFKQEGQFGLYLKEHLDSKLYETIYNFFIQNLVNKKIEQSKKAIFACLKKKV